MHRARRDIHFWTYPREEGNRHGDDRYDRFLADLAAGRPWVIDSVEMGIPKMREKFAVDHLSGLLRDWVYFENDPS